MRMGIDKEPGVSIISFRWDGPFWFHLKALHFFLFLERMWPGKDGFQWNIN